MATSLYQRVQGSYINYESAEETNILTAMLRSLSVCIMVSKIIQSKVILQVIIARKTEQKSLLGNMLAWVILIVAPTEPYHLWP